MGRRRWKIGASVMGPLALLFVGCALVKPHPDLGGLYNRSAQYHAPDRNPIVVMPGVLGSKLVDAETGTIVWGAFGGGAANPRTPEGARLGALPMAEGVPLAQLRDGVVPDGSLDRLRISLLWLMPVQLNAYRNILATLGVGGYRDETLGRSGAVDYGNDHFTCFQFDYDWRRSNVESAKLLHRFLQQKRTYVQEELERRYGVENPDVKFDIVAHSMGGLVARYYLRYGTQELPEDGSLPELTWAGAEYIERIIMVATPNAGAVKAFEQLLHGLHIPTFASYDATILDTLPAIYELLPRPRHGAVVDADHPHRKLDVYDHMLWERMEWGMASPERETTLRYLLPGIKDAEERRRIALDHQRKCLVNARRFHTALDVPARPPDGVELFLLAGDAVPTYSTVHMDMKTGRVRKRETAPGDGTVIRTSALMDERVGQEWTYMLRSPISWEDVTFLFASHLGMTKDPMFSDNVLYLLLEDPRT